MGPCGSTDSFLGPTSRGPAIKRFRFRCISSYCGACYAAVSASSDASFALHYGHPRPRGRNPGPAAIAGKRVRFRCLYCQGPCSRYVASTSIYQDESTDHIDHRRGRRKRLVSTMGASFLARYRVADVRRTPRAQALRHSACGREAGDGPEFPAHSSLPTRSLRFKST